MTSTSPAAGPGPAVVAPDGRVVVVGGGVAGLSVVAELRRLGHVGPLTLLDSGDVLHDRPPLSKAYLLGDVAEQDLAPYPVQQLRDQGVDVRTGTRAVRLGLPPDQHDATRPGRGAGGPVVVLSDGSQIAADAVVLAEGGRAHRLPLPGAELALTLRTLADARVLRPHLGPGRRVVVLGAGLVGAEVAATALAAGADVHLVDPDPLPLAAAVGPVVAQVLLDDHVRLGVRLVTAAAERLTPSAERPGAVTVHVSGAAPLEADVVLVATGMHPVDDVARSAGLGVAPGGGTVVDRFQRTSAPRVLAVGDGSRRRRPDGDPAPSAGHWDAARLDALTAAAVLLGQQPPERGAPWFWTDRHGRHVEVVGDPTAGERTVVRGEPGPDPFAVLAWRDGVVVGAVAVDDPKVARAARRLVDRAVAVDPDALATADLRGLVRG